MRDYYIGLDLGTGSDGRLRIGDTRLCAHMGKRCGAFGCSTVRILLRSGGGSGRQGEGLTGETGE